MTVFLQERRKREDHPGKGRWKAYKNSAVLGCPICGHTINLTDSHIIDDDGSVRPGVRCLAVGGRFYAPRVSLEGWAPNKEEIAKCEERTPENSPQ